MDGKRRKNTRLSKRRAGAEADAVLQAGDRHGVGHPAAAGPGGVEPVKRVRLCPIGAASGVFEQGPVALTQSLSTRRFREP